MSGSRVRWRARRLTIGSEYVLPRRFLGPPVASPTSGFPGRKRSERAVAGGPLRRLQGANARDSPSRCAPEPGGCEHPSGHPGWLRSGSSEAQAPRAHLLRCGPEGLRRKRPCSSVPQGGRDGPRRKRLGPDRASAQAPRSSSASAQAPLASVPPGTIFREAEASRSLVPCEPVGLGASAWANLGSRPGFEVEARTPRRFLRCATVVRRTGRKRPAFRSTAGAPDFLRSANAPFSIRGTDAPGASGAQAPRFSPAAAPGFSRREASSSWRRPSGWTVGTGAAVAPAVSGGSPLGNQDLSRHPGHEGPASELAPSEPRRAPISPARRRLEARPLSPKALRIVHRGLPSFSRALDREAWGPACTAVSRSPPEADREVREDPPLFGTGESAPGDGSESDSLHLRPNRGFTPRPPASGRFHRRRPPDGSGSFRNSFGFEPA